MAKEKGKPAEAAAEQQGQQSTAEQSTDTRSTASAFLTGGKFYDIQSVPGIGAPLGSLLPQITDYGRMRVAGIASIRWIPTFGVASKMSDPLNQAAQSLYNKVQDAMNNRNLPFQGIDLLKACIALDNVHIMYRLIYRAFRTLGRADIANNYLPQALFRAYNFDYEDFRANKAQIREDLATWRDMITKRYPLPRVFKFVDLHEQMSRFIYADNNSRKAQFYVCTPQVLWSWAENDETTFLSRIRIVNWDDAAGLEPGYTGRTYAQARMLLDSMLNAMLNSTDFQRIIAALNTTFQADIVELPDPMGDAVMEFVYDEGFNNCLSNATALPWDDDTLILRYSPTDTNVIVVQPMLKAEARSGLCGIASVTCEDFKFINASNDMPKSDEMTNYMRWHANVDATGAAVSLGTEAIVGLDVWPVSNKEAFHEGVYYQEMETGILPADHNDIHPELAYPLENLGAFTIRTHNAYDQGHTFQNEVLPNYYASHNSGTTPIVRWVSVLAVLDAFDAMFPFDFIHYFSEEGAAGWRVSLDTIPIVHWRFAATTSSDDLKSYHRALLWSALLE